MLNLGDYDESKVLYQSNPYASGRFHNYAEVEFNILLIGSDEQYKRLKPVKYLIFMYESFTFCNDFSLVIRRGTRGYFYSCLIDGESRNYYKIKNKTINGIEITEDDYDKEYRVRIVLPYMPSKDERDGGLGYIYIDNDGYLKERLAKTNENRAGVSHYLTDCNENKIIPYIRQVYEFNK